MKMKCYLGNLDGRRQGVVIANSQKVAARIVGTSVGSFRDFWHEIENWPDQHLIPLTLYTRSYRAKASDPFVEGRCEP